MKTKEPNKEIKDSYIEKSETTMTMLASEDVLKKDWNNELDGKWNDLE